MDLLISTLNRRCISETLLSSYIIRSKAVDIDLWPAVRRSITPSIISYSRNPPIANATIVISILSRDLVFRPFLTFLQAPFWPSREDSLIPLSPPIASQVVVFVICVCALGFSPSGILFHLMPKARKNAATVQATGTNCRSTRVSLVYTALLLSPYWWTRE
jgi:hypothetical protein